MTQDAPRPPLANRRRLSPAAYRWGYVLLYVVVLAGAMGAGFFGLPKEPTFIAIFSVALAAVWFLEREHPTPHSELDKDPFDRRSAEIGRHVARARKLQRREIEWRKTSIQERQSSVAQLFEEKLGVDPEVIVETDELTWIGGERMWWGWPDPERFVVVGFDAAGKVQAAEDIQNWPERWKKPDDWPFEPPKAAAEAKSGG